MKTLKIFFGILLLNISVSVAQTVYTTKSGEKYHKLSCKYLKKSHKEFTLKKAKSLGYKPCKICKPTIESTSDKSIKNKKEIQPPEKKKTKKRETTSQCRGKKKSGERCQNQTKNTDKRCYLHQK